MTSSPTTLTNRPSAPLTTPLRRPGRARNGVTFGNGPSSFAPLA